MTGYYAVYRSNDVLITNPPAVRDLFESEHYLVDGSYSLEDAALTVWSTGTMFDVWKGPGGTENVTEEFLTELSQYLDQETLLIRSVGHEGTKHRPDVYQYRVTPDGDVSTDTLPTATPEPAVNVEAQFTPDGLSVSAYDPEGNLYDETWFTWEEVEEMKSPTDNTAFTFEINP